MHLARNLFRRLRQCSGAWTYINNPGNCHEAAEALLLNLNGNFINSSSADFIFNPGLFFTFVTDNI